MATKYLRCISVILISVTLWTLALGWQNKACIYADSNIMRKNDVGYCWSFYVMKAQRFRLWILGL